MNDLRDLLSLCLAPLAACALAVAAGACEPSSGGSSATDAPAGDDALSDAADAARDGTDEPSTTGAVVVNELAPTGDPADWIELLNRDDHPVLLSGWSLTDSNPSHVFVFGAGVTLDPGAFLVLVRDEPASFGFGLGPADAVHLVDASGQAADSVSWIEGTVPDGLSYGRIPDGTGDFAALVQPTAGQPNVANPLTECGNGQLELGEVCDTTDLGGATCTTLGFRSGLPACVDACQRIDTSGCQPLPRTIVINEVESSGDDRIELFNPGTAPVVIGGWQVGDEGAVLPEDFHTFPAATTLAAGAYVVLVRDQQHTFGVGKSDTIRLSDKQKLLVDLVTWQSGEAEVSTCRIPNGSGDPRPCSTATFGSANVP